MAKEEKVTKILTREIDEGILERMPEWFRVLRTAFRNRVNP